MPPLILNPKKHKYWANFDHDPNGMSSIIGMTRCGQILVVIDKENKKEGETKLKFQT